MCHRRNNGTGVHGDEGSDQEEDLTLLNMVERKCFGWAISIDIWPILTKFHLSSALE